MKIFTKIWISIHYNDFITPNVHPAEKLKMILTMNQKSILEHAGNISHELAIKKGTQEYNKYKAKQKQLEILNSIKELDTDLKKIKKQISNPSNKKQY